MPTPTPVQQKPSSDSAPSFTFSQNNAGGFESLETMDATTLDGVLMKDVKSTV